MSHTITAKSLFKGLITPVMRGQRGEAGEDLEYFDNRDLRMKGIQKLYIRHVVPSQDQETNPINSEQTPAGKTCFYELGIPAYVPDQNGVADCNAGPADGSHIHMHIAPHEIREIKPSGFEADLTSTFPPSQIVGLGSDSVLVFSAKDRIIVSEDQCK
ncbi:hypothetical protein IW261DRAFT_1506660 [Armillaria novae-zelandiae]|uniref:Uncharacterized protein n=1 Tax=Armillaria novae-zelandiae TaxID=153914 RepID=A0AA39T923_9AGAR|nr:hypothetical protein IW261DRAFT_1506660 [Armillaria novae-zelandiae]